MAFLYWPGCCTRGGPHSAMTPSRGVSSCESSCLGVLLRKGWLFGCQLMPPNHLVTHFESVSAFLSYPAPGYPGRDPPLESYLSQRRLWGGRGTSRVRLPYTDAITMALKPPLSSLYYFPGLSGFEALPRRRFLHGLSYPWVSGSHTAIASPLWHLTLTTPYLGDALTGRCLHLGEALPWRRFLLATLALGVPLPRRRFTLTLTLTLSTPGYGTVQKNKLYPILILLDFGICH